MPISNPWKKCLHFYANKFFQWIWNQHPILRFLKLISKCCETNIFNPNAHKRAKKTKNLFFQTWIRINYIFQFWFLTNKVLKSFHPKIPHAKSLNVLFSSLISLFGICSFMSLIFCIQIESVKFFYAWLINCLCWSGWESCWFYVSSILQLWKQA